MAFLDILQTDPRPFWVCTPHHVPEADEEMLSGCEMGIRDAPHPQNGIRLSVVR